MSEKSVKSIEKDFVTFITKFYPMNPQNQSEKYIEIIHSLIESAKDNKLSVNDVLEKTARIINRTFGFREICIGLKNRKDGVFRYQYLLGLRKDVEERYRHVAYTYQDMTSQKNFPFIKVGKFAELDPVEGLPEEEIALLNRPTIFKRTRDKYDTFLEGDYFTVHMSGNNNELIGWMDLSLTIDGKLPTRESIRWIELIANICGLAVQKKLAEQKTI